MEDRARARLAWAISILLHALAFLFLFPGGSPSGGGPGLRLLEVGLVELGQEGGSSIPAALREAAGDAVPQAPPPPLEVSGKQNPAGRIETPTAVSAKPAPPLGGTAPSPTPAPVPMPSGGGGSGTGGGSGSGSGTGGGTGPGSGPDFGTGVGLVRSRPLYYPKGAQNEGVEGRVRLAIVLKPDGSARAELVAPSGDARLDLYGLRAVTEAWRYERPPVPVRLEVELVFAGGEARASFLGSEVLPEEDAP